MTDNKIIKALECCIQSESCEDCIYRKKTNKLDVCSIRQDSLDLINRQKAEIERLKGIINTDVVFVGRRQGKTQESNRLFSLRVAEIKTEAIKEFAERLKKRLERKYTIYGREYVLRHLRDLVKEMTEGN